MRGCIILMALSFGGIMSQTALHNGFTPYIVVGASYTEPENSPPPDPKSETCESCNGTGKIGDGRTVFTCAICDGTGKITKQKAEDLKGIIEFRTKERDKLFQPRGEEAGDRPES